ncbi:T9SS type A sorting domain-containing protein [Dyadobacter sp. CY323]|uniref:T9SS type A sorting domain-containing protein n=1 Tax=Dyadobacter sp. CY323 TaxID=2907302 RepID=UPI001F266ABB|nr:T9SS type A sorting domain-containing protein [Dyadobacter sp. CY323]MCE6991467.1 T9SS type A sorting domain-containing protein [Dyadobacter sp. CY323]
MKKHYSFFNSYLFSLLIAVSALTSQAQDWDHIIKATVADAQGYRKADSQYGRSVAISGNYALVGAPGERPGTAEPTDFTPRGAAYLLLNDNGNWRIVKKLVRPASENTTVFGMIVSMSGDYLTITGGTGQGEYFAFIYYKNQGGAGNWGELKKITAPYLDAASSFAQAISMDGDYLAISSFLDLDGSVHIYKKNEGGTNNWGYLKKLTAPHSENYQDYYGRAICLKDNRLIVGAPAENEDLSEQNGLDNAGAAYIYGNNKGGTDNWGLMSKVIAQNRAANDNLGWSVSISGDFAIVGAWKEDQDAQETATLRDAGAAYIFEKDPASDNWAQVQKITASERRSFDSFGRNVNIVGDVAIVSNVTSLGRDISLYSLETGSIHIFKRNVGGTGNWGLLKKIDEPVTGLNNQFGKVIAFNSQYLLAGAPADETDANGQNNLVNAGSLYIYGSDQGGAGNWGLLKKEVRTLIDRKAEDLFGASVSISGNYAIVGVNGDDEDEYGFNPVENAGAAHIFQNVSGTWRQIQKICAPTRSRYANFGANVSMDGDYAVVGGFAPTTRDGRPDIQGVGYIFKREAAPDNTWKLKQIIQPPSSANLPSFGSSLCINGNYILGGSLNNGNEPGSVLVFKKNPENDDFGQIDEIKSPFTNVASGYFGSAVSLSGDFGVIGGYGMGSVYVIEKDAEGADNWGIVKTISDPAFETNSYGNYVAISGEDLVVGIEYATAGEGPVGIAAKIYNRNTGGTNSWGLVRQIAMTGEEDKRITGVAMDHDNVLVGSVSRPDGSLGRIGLYRKDKEGANQWGNVTTFTSNGYPSVGISGNYFVAGSAHDLTDNEGLPTTDYSAGSVSFYRKTAGTPSNMEIPTTSGNYQSDYTIQEGDLTHYCTGNYLLLSLQQTGTGADIPANAVQFSLGTGASYFTGTTGFLSDTKGTAVVNRKWNVNPATEPTSEVKVRFYYTTEEYEAISAALVANGKKGLTSESQLFFYKVKDNSLGDFPDVKDIPSEKVQVIVQGSVASTTKWEPGIEQGNKYAEFLVTSFSGGGLGGVSPEGSLPVKLSYFQVRSRENQALLEWRTSEETQSDYFEIQKSTDAKSWQTLGKKKAASESKRVLFYDFTDASPSPGTSYYRIKMVDIDASFAYSSIRHVTFEPESFIVIYPNPTADKIYISGIKPELIRSIELVNSSGQLVSVMSPSAQGLSTRKLNPGLYTVTVIGLDGIPILKKSMAKQ